MKIISLSEREEYSNTIALHLLSTEFRYRNYRSFHALSKEIADDGEVMLIFCLERDGVIDLNNIDRIKGSTRYREVPVIVLSADGSELSKAKAFQLGIDDYIVYPFSSLEFNSRISAVARRAFKDKRDGAVVHENIRIDTHRRMVYVGGKEISLTLKEYEMLYILIKNKDRIITKQYLFGEIWKDKNLESTRTLDMHMRTLRRKLGSSGSLIQTIRSVGYRL
ncbi:MAG: response regulator transcription factor [Oscillospiraceae bacterium]|nr:response regulator transcription factor [Oscillospiraceae bacterium]